ncbi:MAG TPA: 2-hydroxymuconate tautomerase family protein [Nitrososphaeraceae archaeon]|nr:2-hydroxymuconate tautomerase family protein [Nitrososphaeraceae archaeon]
MSVHYLSYHKIHFIGIFNHYNMPVIQITMSEGRTLEQKRELVRVLTKETARILNSKEENMRVLIYEVSKENWGNAGILGTDM